eukprot:scaffold67260_cov28-Prasinocladus_malaysianus.AAC.1
MPTSLIAFGLKWASLSCRVKKHCGSVTRVWVRESCRRSECAGARARDYVALLAVLSRARVRT